MSGMALKFDGLLENKYTSEKNPAMLIEKTASGSSFHHVKTFPAGVYFFLIEGWKDSLLESSADPTLVEFLKSKGAEEVHKECVAAIKAKGKAMMGNAIAGYYSSKKIIPLLNDKFVAAYAEKGIKAVISKVAVVEPYREFLWIELIDTAKAGGYTPALAMGK